MTLPTLWKVPNRVRELANKYFYKWNKSRVSLCSKKIRYIIRRTLKIQSVSAIFTHQSDFSKKLSTLFPYWWRCNYLHFDRKSTIWVFQVREFFVISDKSTRVCAIKDACGCRVATYYSDPALFRVLLCCQLRSFETFVSPMAFTSLDLCVFLYLKLWGGGEAKVFFRWVFWCWNCTPVHG